MAAEIRLAHFRAVTMGKPVVMGRKTYLSIGRPLPGRTNIVVSRDRGFAAPGVLVAPSLEAALTAARGDALRRGADEIAVIGGADLYAQTHGAGRPAGDHARAPAAGGRHEFPAIDPDVWRETERSEHPAGPGDEAGFTVLAYERSAAQPRSRCG